MPYQRRSYCIGGEQEPAARPVDSQRSPKPLACKQFLRLVCPETDPSYLNRIEANDRAVEDNVSLFLRTFTARKLSKMRSEEYDLFESGHNTDAPKIYRVSAMTHLSLGSIARYGQTDNIENQLEKLPGYGALEMGMSVEPPDSDEFGISVSLLPASYELDVAPFTPRALYVAQRTVDEINY